MKPHRDDYVRAFAERHGGPDTIASWIIGVVLGAVVLQLILGIIGWPERVGRCEPGTIYAEPGSSLTLTGGRVYDCTPQGTWRLRGAK